MNDDISITPGSSSRRIMTSKPEPVRLDGWPLVVFTAVIVGGVVGVLWAIVAFVAALT